VQPKSEYSLLGSSHQSIGEAVYATMLIQDLRKLISQKHDIDCRVGSSPVFQFYEPSRRDISEFLDYLAK
jgi:hypothetical protein